MAQINWNHPNISKIPPEKIIILKKITQDLETLNITQNTLNTNNLSYILALTKKLKEANLTFTPEEYTLLLGCIKH